MDVFFSIISRGPFNRAIVKIAIIVPAKIPSPAAHPPAVQSPYQFDKEQSARQFLVVSSALGNCGVSRAEITQD